MHLQGQTLIQEDTILIKEVVINRKTVSASAGFKVMPRFYPLTITIRTLADLLSENTSLFVKSYGSGGLATPSFRGTGPGHTQISWNNINLNNPMLGQFDMSLVPAGFADDVKISYGGGSMDINNGGIGGIINIETKPDWDNENVLFINPGFGSFGRYSGLVRVRTGNTRFQSVTKAFLSSAENNFLYLNIRSREPSTGKKENNQVKQKDSFRNYILGKGMLFQQDCRSDGLKEPACSFEHADDGSG
jgi:outer membrane receptor protein involved in Fe transport